MKTIEQEAKKIAYTLFYNRHAILMNIQPKLDMRYKVNQIAWIYYNDLKNSVNRGEIKNLQKQRNEVKKTPSFINIFDRPIIKDYTSNRYKGLKVYHNRLNYGNRNHWAKDEKDIRILKILSKFN